MIVIGGDFISNLEVDLSAIKENLKRIKQLLNNNQKLCFVAKANCYGLGDEKICQSVNGLVDYFAVAKESEFLRIKKYVTKPILILNPIYENITICARQGAEFCVCNFESLEVVLSLANQNKCVQFKIHIAINTGMNRFGFSDFDYIKEVFKMCEKTQNISIIGVFTHYYSQIDENIAEIQFSRFEKYKRLIDEFVPTNKLIFHIANTGGVQIKNGFDMVRVGFGMYDDSVFETIKLSSKILDFQELNACDTAGYEAVFKASRKTKIAVVGIGYADGVFRNVYKKGYVLINNCFAKIIAVCMDSMLVDVTEIDCKICDEVILIGKSESRQIFICDMASWCDTIGYEVIAKLSSRIKRIYKE